MTKKTGSCRFPQIPAAVLSRRFVSWNYHCSLLLGECCNLRYLGPNRGKKEHCCSFLPLFGPKYLKLQHSLLAWMNDQAMFPLAMHGRTATDVAEEKTCFLKHRKKFHNQELDTSRERERDLHPAVWAEPLWWVTFQRLRECSSSSLSCCLATDTRRPDLAFTVLE